MTEPNSDGNPKPKFLGLSKRMLFVVILAVAASVAGVISLFAFALIDRTNEHEIRFAVIAPLTGPDQALGTAIRRGAAQYVDQVNRTGGLGGQPLRLLVLNDGGDPAKAREAAKAAADQGAVGVVGHWSADAAAAAGGIYRDRGIPAVTVSAAPDADVPGNPWLFRMSFNQAAEIRFLANYVRNVIGEKIVSIIHPIGAEGEAQAALFDEVMQRFGTKVLNRWDYDPASPAAGDRLSAIAADIKDRMLIGSVLVLGDPQGSAKVLAALRRAGLQNKVVGPRVMATQAFRSALAEEWREKASLASVLNGVLVTSPLLFDTAGELSQSFKNGFVQANRAVPDWLAAGSFDAMRLLVQAHGKPQPASGPDDPTPARQRLRDHLAELGTGPKRFDGLMGPVAFDDHNVSSPTIAVGVYDGTDLVAALTQLSPIREENVGNYLDELIAGRALYVNDRFMYKTNVVYSGLKLAKISGLDIAANTVAMEFDIWFRWRGTVEPQDIVFVNAVEDVKLDKPEREMRQGDMTYRSYRVKGKFFLNYSTAERAYGTDILGVAFHHRTLNRNNLMYVSDIIGMELNDSSTLAEKITDLNIMGEMGSGSSELSWFQRIAGSLPLSSASLDPLVQDMQRSHVLASVSGWVLDRAWISQDISRRGALGDPAFVGFGKPQPEFSQLDLGALLKPDQIDIRDFIPSRFFLAIAIFSAVGTIVASALDRKERGQFWRMQTLGLRILAWPLLLMSAGNMLLDYGLLNFSTSTVDTIVLVYSALWWLVPARLVAISVERFVWVPLELRTKRKIPNVVRLMTSLVIYLFAIFGVVAFVMGKTVTSLLATSGLMAMIIGLAVQANISNVFSGIVLNIERPFSVGDWIKINSAVGQVIDITWRTIRIQSLGGHLICLANAKVSEAEILNFSAATFTGGDFMVQLDIGYPPDRIVELINACLEDTPGLIGWQFPWTRPEAVYGGVEWINGRWVDRFPVRFRIEKLNDTKQAAGLIWQRIWQKFQEEGITWNQPPEIDDDPASPPLLTALPAPAAPQPALVGGA